MQFIFLVKKSEIISKSTRKKINIIFNFNFHSFFKDVLHLYNINKQTKNNKLQTDSTKKKKVEKSFFVISPDRNMKA